MKDYDIRLSAHEGATIAMILRDDLDDLVLDDHIRIAYEVILDGANSTGFRFTLDDTSAPEVVQTMLVYADRLFSAEDDRGFACIRFATQMLTPITGKTEDDY